jgi:hypothetical protein
MPTAGNPVVRTRVEPAFRAACIEKSERTGIDLSAVLRVALENFLAESDEESLARLANPVEGVATPVLH